MNKFLYLLASLMFVSAHAENSFTARFTEVFSEGAVTANEADALLVVEAAVVEKKETRPEISAGASSTPMTLKSALIGAGVLATPVVIALVVNYLK